MSDTHQRDNLPTTTDKPEKSDLSPDEIFDTSKSFADLGLGEAVLKGIADLGFEHPTKVQADLIPHALSGRDLIAQSKTGTGKTAAFGLPILQLLDDSTRFAALALVPTRELAIQVARELLFACA